MGDVLIRDVPEAVLAAVDAKAARLGLSRAAYVRRRLAQDAAGAEFTVTTKDLRRFGVDFKDLADLEVMAGAWE